MREKLVTNGSENHIITTFIILFSELQAILAEYEGLRYYLSKDKTCEMRVVRDKMFQVGLAFGIKKDLSWKSLINQAMLNLQGRESITNLRKKWFHPVCQPKFFVTENTPFTIIKLSGLIFLLILTIVVAFLLLISENWSYKYVREPLLNWIKKIILRIKQ